MHRWVPLGGWAGPSLVLRELGINTSSGSDLPFDNIRTSFDGIISFAAPQQHGRPATMRGYLPEPIAAGSTAAIAGAFGPEAAGPHTLLFRGRHTCFHGADLNSGPAMGELLRRWAAWESMLAATGGSGSGEWPAVTFLRSVIAEDALEELARVPEFNDAVRSRTGGRLPFRTVMVVAMKDDEEGSGSGGSGKATPAAQPLSALCHPLNPCVVWGVRRAAPAGAGTSLAPRTLNHSSTPATTAAAAAASVVLPAEAELRLLAAYREGYRSVVTTMNKELKWKQLPATLPPLEEFIATHRAGGGAGASAFYTPTELRAIHGVPVFASAAATATATATAERSAERPPQKERQPGDQEAWAEEETDALLMAYGMRDGDEVLAAETYARESPTRSALDAYAKLQELLGKDLVEEEEEVNGAARRQE